MTKKQLILSHIAVAIVAGLLGMLLAKGKQSNRKQWQRDQIHVPQILYEEEIQHQKKGNEEYGEYTTEKFKTIQIKSPVLTGGREETDDVIYLSGPRNGIRFERGRDAEGHYIEHKGEKIYLFRGSEKNTSCIEKLVKINPKEEVQIKGFVCQDEEGHSYVSQNSEDINQ